MSFDNDTLTKNLPELQWTEKVLRRGPVAAEACAELVHKTCCDVARVSKKA
jgi:hypothetical protein